MSNPGSTEGSAGALEAPQATLDVLIGQLLSAKRSLSSINHVWRANEIVKAAQAALEDSVVLGAKTGFLRRGIANQLKILYRVQTQLNDIDRDGQGEFEVRHVSKLEATNMPKKRAYTDLL
jgi:autophagy-related protein 17